MGIWQSKPFQNALNGAVLAIATVQGVEHDIRRCLPQRGDRHSDIGACVDRRDGVSGFTQRGRNSRATAQADTAFVRDAALQDGHMDAHAWFSAVCRPRRLISQ